MSLIGTIAIYDDNTTQINIPGWIKSQQLQKMFLANQGAREILGQPFDSPEVVKLAAQIMARASNQKRKSNV